MRIKSLVALMALLPSLLLGTIVETNRFDDIIPYLEEISPENLLVVCDIDNTLLQSTHELGSVAWGEYMINLYISKGISKRNAEEIESILWKTVRPHISVEPVDPRTSSVIEEIQRRKIPIIALTARSPDELDYTFEELESVMIDFSKQKVASNCYLHFETNSKAMFLNGVLFATLFNTKASVLLSFLEKYQMTPDRIIFVDDKRHHVEDIEKACLARGIECIGIRFGGADERCKKFNPDIAMMQWESFPFILSNEDCSKKLSFRASK